MELPTTVAELIATAKPEKHRKPFKYSDTKERHKYTTGYWDQPGIICKRPESILEFRILSVEGGQLFWATLSGCLFIISSF
jgi:hypothetical protein